jgi:cytochrome c oxidase subunit 2
MRKIFTAIIVLIVLFAMAPVFAATQLPTLEAAVIAKRYEFYPAQIAVHKGQPLRLYLTSIDVKHGFAVPDFKINKDMNPGEVTVVEFTPNKTGEFLFRCSVFCGLGHIGMTGKLFVVD